MSFILLCIGPVIYQAAQQQRAFSHIEKKRVAMLIRKLHDFVFKFSAYNNRLTLEDVEPGMHVLVMYLASPWGKSLYDFTGVIVSVDENQVVIQDRKRAVTGRHSEEITNPPADLGLINGGDTQSTTFLLRANWQNHLSYAHS